MAADLVIRGGTVIDGSGAERLTADAPTGITHVLVNGTPIQADAAQVEAGIAARSGQRPALA